MKAWEMRDGRKNIGNAAHFSLIRFKIIASDLYVIQAD
jgi:hypothetical protein